MKWYETPIEDLYGSALLALARLDCYAVSNADCFKELNYRRQLIRPYKQAIKRLSLRRHVARASTGSVPGIGSDADPFPHAVLY